MPELADGIIVPQKRTVENYGLTMDDWYRMNTGVCHCCLKKPASGRLNIDHEHVKGWKKMEPAERRKYVRGLCCYVCNRFILNSRITATLLRLAADYLDRYGARKGVQPWPMK